MSAVAAPVRAEWDGRGVTVDEVVDRLAAQRRPADGGVPFMLSGVLNLVGYAWHPSEVEAMHEVIEGLADHQPSRAVVLCGEPEGEGLDAMVSTSCRISGEHNGVALETVRLTLRGETREGAASATVPLLRSDLPTVLWWPWAPDHAAETPLASLAAIADRVVTESSRAADPSAAVRALADWVPDAAPAVTDLAWAAITGWRQLIAQMVEGESLANLRGGPATTLIAHAPGAPGADALLLAGWLRDAIGPGLTVTLEAREDQGGPGIVAVELESSVARRLVVERAAGRDAAAVCVTEADGTTHSRVLPLPRPDRARLLAGELELQRRDHAFERALAGACAAGVA